jgi:hypothetical protein
MERDPGARDRGLLFAMSERPQNGRSRNAGKRFAFLTAPAVVVLALLVLPPLHAAETSADQPVPVVNGEAGPCSVEFTVTDGAGRRVYDARIHVHIEYGLLGLRTLDLEIGTNANGMARFEGLPEDPDGVLFFRAKKGKLRGFAFYYPNEECHGKHHIVLTEGPAMPSTSSSLPRRSVRG